MSFGSANPFACESLEGRTMMSASLPTMPVLQTSVQPAAVHAPLTATISPMKSGRTTGARSTLAGFIVGTWVNTIGALPGVTMQLRHIYNADGTYLVQKNFKTDSYGMPYQTRWITYDYGTWKAQRGTYTIGMTGTIVATSNARGSRGHQSIEYITAESSRIIDVGVMPANASENTRPVWMHFGRML